MTPRSNFQSATRALRRRTLRQTLKVLALLRIDKPRSKVVRSFLRAINATKFSNQLHGIFAVQSPALGLPLTLAAIGVGLAAGAFITIWFDPAWGVFPPIELDTIGKRSFRVFLFLVAAFTLIHGLRKLLIPTPLDSFLNGRRLAFYAKSGLAAAIVVVIFAYCVPLFIVWASGETAYLTIGGLLPWSDAQAYHYGTIRLLNTGTIDGWNQRRPINVVVNAVFHALAGRDLPTKLFLNAIILALCTLLAGWEFMRTHGVAAAAAFVMVVLSLAFPYVPTTMSENNGLIFGLIAFALLWRFATKPHVAIFGAGLFFLTVALNARAGAFFILPAIIGWEIIRSRRQWRKAFMSAFIGIAAVFAGFALPLFYVSLWGAGDGMVHGNFAYVLYGLAAGGKGWEQIYTDHPEILSLSGQGEQARAIYLAAFDLILRQPGEFVWAIVVGLLRFVSRLGQLTTVPSALSVAALPVLLFVERGPHVRLFFAALLGLVLSAPFIFQDGGPRVYAATYPFFAVFLGLLLHLALRFLTAFVACLRGWRPEICSASPQSSAVSLRAPFVAIALGVSLFAGPPLLVTMLKNASFPLGKCPDGQIGVAFFPRQDIVRLQVLPDDRLARSFVPVIRYSDYIRDPNFRGIAIAPVLRRISPPAQIIYIVGRSSRNVFVIFDEGRKLPESEMPIQLCGEALTKEQSGWGGRVLYNPTVKTLATP